MIATTSAIGNYSNNNNYNTNERKKSITYKILDYSLRFRICDESNNNKNRINRIPSGQ